MIYGTSLLNQRMDNSTITQEERERIQEVAEKKYDIAFDSWERDYHDAKHSVDDRIKIGRNKPCIEDFILTETAIFCDKNLREISDVFVSIMKKYPHPDNWQSLRNAITTVIYAMRNFDEPDYQEEYEKLKVRLSPEAEENDDGRK